MRRTIFIGVVFMLLTSGMSWADENVAGSPAADLEAGGVCDGSTLTAMLATRTPEEIKESQSIEPAPPVEMGGVPLNCPTTSSCVGGSNYCRRNPANCAATGSSSSIDFGSSSCELPSGSFFTCKAGKTVHLVTTQCQQCSCCSTTPACVCPLNCGEARTLECL